MKNWTRKLINELCYSGLDRASFYEDEKEFDKFNKKISMIICCILLGLFFVVDIVSNINPFFFQYKKVYIVFTIALLLLIVWIDFFIKGRWINVATGILRLGMYAYGLYAALVVSPNMVAVTLVALLVIVPSIFYNRPYSFIIETAIVEIIFFTLAPGIKPAEALNGDLIDVTIFGIGGIAIGILNMRIRVRSIDAQRLLTNQAAMLQQQSAELTEQSAELTNQAAQLQQQAAELQEAYAVAESASQAKSDFLSSVSHEIRTPMNAILGLDELILRETSEDNIKGYAFDIRGAGNTLITLINDLLDMSKIEAGKMELVPTAYEFSSMLNDVVNMIQTKADQKGLELVLDIDENIPRILFGDEIRIKQILVNILSNAVKYTREGKVELSIKVMNVFGDIVLLKTEVTDTGIGMKPEAINHLFDPFERMDKVKNRHIEGTGLGMTITGKLLRLMDSALLVDSEYGKGSKFSFEILQRIEDKEPIGNYRSAFKRLREKNVIYNSRLTASGVKILVVDDNEINLAVFEGLLKNTGIEVVSLLSGEEALNSSAREKFDLIFLDHMMPDLDGVETLRLMEKNPDDKNKETPKIVFTANAIAGVRNEYIEIGFDDYIAKPVDPEKLEKTIIRFLPKEKYNITRNQGDEIKLTGSGLETLMTSANISLLDGIKNSGGIETYKIVIEKFLNSYEEKRGDILEKLVSNDIKNYTILVHGLKSEARLVGDMELYNLAYKLELAGKEEELEVIRNLTDELLLRYENTANEIKGLLGEEKNDIESNKPHIGKADLLEAFRCMNQAVEAFDIDVIKAILAQLDEYEVDPDDSEKLTEIKRCVERIDFEGLRVLVHE